MAFQTLNGKQIRNHSIEDRHINGKLSENVLDIKWSDVGHAEDILRNKSIIDYIQLNELISIPAGVSASTVMLSLDNAETVVPGVLLNTPIRLRDEFGDPVTDGLHEIVGKLAASEEEPTEGKFAYTLQFTTQSGEPYIFDELINIEFLYPVRTTLWDACETFASNERFVDSAVDIRTRLDIVQLAKDIFGPQYEYNADGMQSVQETILAQLLRLTSGSLEETEEITATNIIDEVFTARGSKASLNERLNTSLRPSGVLHDNEKIHTHGKFATTIAVDTTALAFASYTGTPIETIQLLDGIDDLEVYINGNLQIEGINYVLAKNELNIMTGVNFEPAVLMEHDTVILKWTHYNKYPVA